MANSRILLILVLLTICLAGCKEYEWKAAFAVYDNCYDGQVEQRWADLACANVCKNGFSGDYRCEGEELMCACEK